MTYDRPKPDRKTKQSSSFFEEDKIIIFIYLFILSKQRTKYYISASSLQKGVSGDTEDCDSSYSHIMCDRMVHRWTLLYKNTILMTDKRCTIYLSHPKEIRRHYEEDH